MSEKEKNEQEVNENIITLTEEDGKTVDFEIIGQYEYKGTTYFAMIPVEDEDNDSDILEYVILKLAVEDGEEVLVTVDDDDESADVEDYFNDLFSREIDYDN